MEIPPINAEDIKRITSERRRAKDKQIVLDLPKEVLLLSKNLLTKTFSIMLGGQNYPTTQEAPASTPVEETKPDPDKELRKTSGGV